MSSQIGDIHPQLYNALYTCRSNPQVCETLLPQINKHTPVRYCDAGSFFGEVASLLDFQPTADLAAYAEELQQDACMEARYNLAAERGIIRSHPTKPLPLYKNRLVPGSCEGNLVLFYALFRELKPDLVVETGTCAGSMSSYIVAALHRNGKGRMISIDLPPSANKMPTLDGLRDEDVGFLIPEEYRDHWTLVRGDAKALLPGIMMENDVDVFFHDSLHTRTHMAFELAVARAFMKEGSAILSDDTLTNHSFWKFVETHRLPALACTTNPQIAVCRNVFDDFEKDIGIETVRS